MLSNGDYNSFVKVFMTLPEFSILKISLKILKDLYSCPIEIIRLTGKGQFSVSYWFKGAPRGHIPV